MRPSAVADEKAPAEWPAVEVCPVELVEDRQRETLLVECRARKIQPPGRTRVEKVLVAARGKWEKTFCARTIGRLGQAGTARLLSLVAEDNEAGTALVAALKHDPGAVGLDSLLTEIRARAIKLYPSDFRDTSEDVLRITCSRRCARPGRRRSPTRWSTCWSLWSTRSTHAPSGGWRSSSPPS
ncbi:hypothetical protein O7599_29735 [Streptomyces sp. WMMC500]|uniref:hypothetical protein n=1 Tax=Streptomyces sp. WMMC500 TaxID=3015154 RepID=UPI00248C3FBA|nr:hypothetical protein [Streptomyces sp. WMMC500]WBB59699.1 hypothetical protein O7599_29735 [Streptomyces sp. WMMC500]